MPAESGAQTQNMNRIETVSIEKVSSGVQVLGKHHRACEAVKEPIHYCCALWIYVGYEI